MPTFAQRITADDVLDAAPEAVWPVFADPHQLAALAPLVDRIAAEGARWRWHLTGINRLGMTAAPVFTTLVAVDGTAMDFAPDPARQERAAARGRLEVVAAADGGTRVLLDLTATVELPLPALAERGVTRVMYTTLKAGGTRFADNLVAALGHPARRGLAVRRAAVVAA